MFEAVALVSLQRPQRYAKQLVAHLAHEYAVAEDADSSTLTIGTGQCRVTPKDDAVALEASAPDEAQLDVVCREIAEHLEWFAKDQDVHVHWSVSSTTS